MIKIMYKNNITISVEIAEPLKEFTSHVVVVKDIDEAIYLPFIYQSLEKYLNIKSNQILNVKVKSDLMSENLKGITCIIINNRYNVLSRDCKIKLLFKNSVITYEFLIEYLEDKNFMEKLRNPKEDNVEIITSTPSAVNEKKLVVSKSMVVIYICKHGKQIASKVRFEALKESPIVNVLEMDSFPESSELLFYKHDTDGNNTDD